MNEIFNLLTTSTGTLPDELKLEFEKIMVPRTFGRWEFLVRPGKVNEKLFFIIGGTARCFTTRQSATDGEQDVNRQFLLETDFFGSIYRFHHRIVEDQFVQALKPCQVLVTSIKKYEATMQEFPQFYRYSYETWCRTVKEDRVADMLRLPSAAEKYEFLLRNFGNLAREIPGKYLASFMGLDTTTLYKIKGRKVKG
jgi:CRP-like cAMP-binding protein